MFAKDIIIKASVHNTIKMREKLFCPILKGGKLFVLEDSSVSFIPNGPNHRKYGTLLWHLPLFDLQNPIWHARVRLLENQGKSHITCLFNVRDFIIGKKVGSPSIIMLKKTCSLISTSIVYLSQYIKRLGDAWG